MKNTQIGMIIIAGIIWYNTHLIQFYTAPCSTTQRKHSNPFKIVAPNISRAAKDTFAWAMINVTRRLKRPASFELISESKHFSIISSLAQATIHELNSTRVCKQRSAHTYTLIHGYVSITTIHIETNMYVDMQKKTGRGAVSRTRKSCLGKKKKRR